MWKRRAWSLGLAAGLASGFAIACDGDVATGAGSDASAGASGGEAGAGSAGNASAGTTGGSSQGSTGAVMADASATAFVKRLGRDHFMIGLAGPDLPATGKLDIVYRYLVRGSDDASSWPSWNSPRGEYATYQAAAAKAAGAIPMFTTYEFTGFGEANVTGVQNATYMALFWADMRLLAEKLRAFDGPAIVHIEPDFWGYAQQQGGNDATKIKAFVPSDAPCSGLPQDLTGLGRCVVRIFHTTAPKVVIGLHASVFGAFDSAGRPDGAAVGRFLQQCTGGEADFVATDVLDRDAGCFEAKPREYPCDRGERTGWYWDESNQTSPNFREFFTWCKAMHTGAVVPTLWWQVPMGVPSPTPGGSAGKYRDNRVRYFMSHISELIEAGGVGAAFGAGADGQTTQKTDDGQFERALNAYNANPVVLKD